MSIYWHSHLSACEQLSDSHSVVVQSVEIEGDGEWDTYLVCPGISLSDGLGSVIDLCGDQTLLQVLL